MNLKSLKVKNESYYFWDDQVYLEDFDEKFLKIVKRVSRIDADIHYISYVVKKEKYGINSVNPLYLVAKNLLGIIERIKGSKDLYLVVDDSNKTVLNVFEKLFKFVGDKIYKNKW